MSVSRMRDSEAVRFSSVTESRIRDTDMAQEMTNFSKSQILMQAGTAMHQEMTNFSKSQILMQAGTAMLAQANSAPQGVLSLLRG